MLSFAKINREAINQKLINMERGQGEGDGDGRETAMNLPFQI